MDPNKAYFDLLTSIRSGDAESAADAAEALAKWIGNNGFEPMGLQTAYLTALDVQNLLPAAYKATTERR